MPLKMLPAEEPSLNLTPMVDIVFLLIIFFMVGTQFSEMEASVDVKLPTASDVQPLTGRPDAKIVDIRPDGTIQYEKQDVSLEELRVRLDKAREAYAEQAVILRGDRDCQYQMIMDVISVCRRAKIGSISLAKRPETP